MKTALFTLLEEARKYQKESGNDSIRIDLLEQGIKGIYSSLEKQQIIEAYDNGQNMNDGEQYYENTFKN